MLASKQYFSDGFPKDPHEVLDFIDESIFQDYLGPKEEWLEWLSLASQENIDEFVNTVHDLWIEKNQKSAPAAVPTPAPVSPMDEVPAAAAPIKQTEKVEIKEPEPTPVIEAEEDEIEEEESAEEEVVTPVKTETKKPDFVKSEPKTEQANPFNNQPVKTQDRMAQSNNQSNTRTQDRTQDNTRNQDNSRSNRPNQDSNQPNRNNNQNVSNPTRDTNINKQDDKAITLQDDSKSVNYKSFDIKKVRETATKLELDQVYKGYLESKDSFANVEKTYFESQSALFDKLMTIVVNFEQVADYFESMTEKLLDMNEKIIAQGRELQAVKTSLISKNQDLDDKTQMLDSDIQRVERDLRDTKSVNSRRYQELSEVASRINNDSFGDEVTIKSRMDLIDAKLAKLNNQMNASSKIASLTSIATEVNGKKKSN